MFNKGNPKLNLSEAIRVVANRNRPPRHFLEIDKIIEAGQKFSTVSINGDWVVVPNELIITVKD